MNRFTLLILLAALSSPIVRSDEANLGAIRVLTLNVFAGREGIMDFDRLARQIKAVKALQPHIVCLQEVFDHRVRKEYRKAFGHFQVFGDKQDTSIWQLDFFLSAFAAYFARDSEYVSEAWPFAAGYRTDTTTLVDKKRGNGLSNTLAVDLLHFGAPETGYSEEQLQQINLLERLKPKNFTRVDYQVDGVAITVANMRLSNGVTNPKRLPQLREVVGTLYNTHTFSNAQNHRQNPIILCGDTNADGEQPEMKWIREDAHFHDTFLEANPSPDSTHHKGMTWTADNKLAGQGYLAEPDQRVDFVLFAAGHDYTFKTLSSRIVLDEYPTVSDHFGVLSELQLVPVIR